MFTLARDSGKPSAAASFKAKRVGKSVRLSWKASKDNVGVSGYLLYVNGKLSKRLGANARSATLANSGKAVRFTLVARDRAGNVSKVSAVKLAAVKHR